MSDEESVESSAVVPADWTPADRQANTLSVLRLAIADLDRQRIALREAGDYATLAHGGADVAALANDLGILLASVRRDLADLVDALPRKNRRSKPRVEVAGLGVVEVEGGTEWKDWDSERLLRDLVAKVLVSEDGELLQKHPLDAAAAIVELLLDVLPMTASFGWRRGSKSATTGEWSGLRGRGIELEDYGSKVSKPRMATIPKRK